jgi:hypothetical protein
MRRLLLSVFVAALVSVPLASAALRQATRYPSSMVVLGTSTAAGWGADAAHPFRAAPEDSWATGTNPAVQSIYSRILAMNPTIKGHNVNLVGGGSAP